MPKKTEREIIWILVNTNSTKEAEKIGKAVLKLRLAACYGLWARMKSVYYWPPKAGKLETSKGPTLILETLEKNHPKISSLVKKMHSDKVPFIGVLEIEDVDKDFYAWLKGEVR